jgi:YNFM family putative membrane transporter
VATSAAICTAVLAVATLYAPQPMLHLLAARFALAKAEASLVITLTMLPLSFAPIVYGVVLESVSAGRLASVAIVIIALGHVGVAFATTWPLLLAFRAVQGLAVPAVLTSIMTLLSESATLERIRRVMALYIAATIFGGFFGRFGAGLTAWAFGWEAPFLALSALSVLAGLVLMATAASGAAGFERPDFSKVWSALRAPALLRVYLMVFCCFFAFTATLNYLPFRLEELEGGVSPLRTGTMYLGYMVGILAALLSTRMAESMGERGVLRLGIVIFGCSVASCLVPSGDLLLAVLFPFCAGFFLVQSVGPGVVNAATEGKKGVVNGLYIAFYYGGGTLGSFAPGLVYHHLGWTAFIAVLVGVIGIAFHLTGKMSTKAR